jgi:hypothetical protein
MIKVENADQDGQRRATITDGIYVNVSATEQEVDELIVKLLAWKGDRLFLDVVFDGPPSHESGRFVEVEDPDGKSVNAGQWIDRGDGMWALRLPRLATRAGEAVVDETFLRKAAGAMKHGPEGLGGRGDCSPTCTKCCVEEILDRVRTTAKPGDNYKFDYPNENPTHRKMLKVVSVTGTGLEDLVFFDDGTHSKQKNLSPTMRA